MAPLLPIPEWIALEHRVQEILTQQEIHGWKFDTKAAWQLTSTLQEELRAVTESLRRRHPYVDGGTFTPKRDNSRYGYAAGASSTRLKEFNPTSRDHQSWILQTFYGWTPKSLTATVNPLMFRR